MESALAQQLRRQPDLESRLRLASETLAAAGTFDSGTVELLWSELRPAGPEALRGWLESLPAGVNFAYLRALAAEGSPAAWEQFFSACEGRDPLHRLAYARALAGDGRREEAARQLQLALERPVRYAFFPRAAGLVKTLGEGSGMHLREARIAVLGSSTTSLLIPVLEALCLRDRIRARFYQGLYGAIEQESLDPESGLAKFKPDIVLVVTHWRDLALPAFSSKETEAVEQAVRQYAALWDRLAGRFPCHVVQHAFDFPAEESLGYLAGSVPGGRSRVIEAINRGLREAAPAFVSLLDVAAVQRQAGAAPWEDPLQWHSFKQHPATDALPALAEAQMAHIRSVLGLTRKVLIADLDNTLWKGIIGEDGLDGIQIGPGSAAGEAHRRLQEYMRELKSRGVLLAVCSKNNLEDARLPFEKHPHMALRLEDFAAFVANWNDKASNIRYIAETLSLGLDSFVFADDNPLEREWVRSQLPQVTVVELSSSPLYYVRDLDRGQYFYSLKLSQEDLVRAEQYRSESQRELLRASAQSMDEFLAQLNLEAAAVPVTAANLGRVTQLTNKTNQFNLTTRRYTEAQVSGLAATPGAWAAGFHLADRMGSYGLIGVVFCVPTAPDRWEVDTWLMSCRVLGRQMEQYMFDRMMEAAAGLGIREITGVYRPTGKNGLVAEHYTKLGFEAVDNAEKEIRYRIAVPASPTPTANHIRDLSSRTAVSA